MSHEKLVSILNSAKLRSADRIWYGRWVDAYRRFFWRWAARINSHSPRPRDRFLAAAKDRRTEGVAAIADGRGGQFYQQRVLCSSDPTLGDIGDALAEFVRQHPEGAAGACSLIDVAGQIDPNEPQPIQEFRRQLCRLGREYRTEKAYVKWARRFVARYEADTIARLQLLGESEVTEFLTDLAVDRNVTSDTQNQAFNALLKLFEHVARKELRGIDAVRATKPRKLPLVLSREEIDRLLCQFRGRNLLIANLLYGAGLRINDGLRLRVKDIAFDLGQIVVRDTKGEHQRITVLPEVTVGVLRSQIELARELHQRDLARSSHLISGKKSSIDVVFQPPTPAAVPGPLTVLADRPAITGIQQFQEALLRRKTPQGRTAIQSTEVPPEHGPLTNRIDARLG